MLKPRWGNQDEKMDDPERPNGPGGEGVRESGSGGPGGEGSNGSGRSEGLRYVGLASQVAVSVGVAIFLGIRSDKWLHMSFPIFSCALPLLVIVLIMVNLVKESSRRKNGK